MEILLLLLVAVVGYAFYKDSIVKRCEDRLDFVLDENERLKEQLKNRRKKAKK